MVKERFFNRKFALLAFCFITFLPAKGHATNQIKNQVAFYIDTFGKLIPEQNNQVALTHQIFERVRSVADKSSKRMPKLVVVNNLNDSWAIALPSGHIVLSLKAIKICHQTANKDQVKARLAFVLGHELAHLANDDFWHNEIDSFLSTNPKTEHIARFLNKNFQAKESELAADDKGFVYAALAGYAVETLVTRQSGVKDFFEFWMRQTNSRPGDTHPSPRDRSAMLKQRLESLNQKIAFFEYGVRLSHFGFCDDAVYFLREFQRHFPGRAVLNNLGFCYLKMALEAMHPHRAYFYWMPLLLDVESHATRLTRDVEASTKQTASSLKSLRREPGKANDLLKDAISYLELAHKTDPFYLPAKVNLAVAHLYLGQPHQARSILADDYLSSPKTPIIEELKGIALYEQSDADIDLWPAALNKLEQLAAENSDQPMHIYNLARLLTIRPRILQARIFWNRLASMASDLPPSIKAIVCREQVATSPNKCARSTSARLARKKWQWPFPETNDKPPGADHRPYVKGWKTTNFDWYNDKLFGFIYRHPSGKAEILELNQFVHMQVIKNKLGFVGELLDYCGFPLRVRSLVIGAIWSCEHWAAYSIDNEIQEVWWVAH